MNKYDVVIIGAGVGGYTAAIRLAQYGRKVALIEKEKAGGVCLNKGCIPTKALLHVSSEYYRAKQGKARNGIVYQGVHIELDKMRKWKNSVSDRLSKGLLYLFKHYGIEFIQGEADVLESAVKVENRTLFYDSVILATGSRPNIPTAFANIPYWTSYEALEVPEIPENLVIIGGGIIGVELASFYAMMGAKVSIVELLPDILSFLDSDLRSVKKKELKRLGITIYTSASFTGFGNNTVRVKVGDGSLKEIKANRILIATGRKPNAEIAKKMDIQTEGGFVEVNPEYRTNRENVFAIGDLVKGPMLAHRAHHDGINVAEFIVNNRVSVKCLIPQVVYGEISLVSIGKSEDELREEKASYSVGMFPFSANGRSLTMESAEGFCKILAEPDTGKILGVHIAGKGTEELSGEISLAVSADLKVEQLADTVHAHPTLSEVIMEAAENFYRKSIHVLNREK